MTPREEAERDHLNDSGCCTCQSKEIAALRLQVERLEKERDQAEKKWRDLKVGLLAERNQAIKEIEAHRQDSQRLREALERFVRIMTWADTQKSWLQLEDKLLVSELSRCRYDAEIVLTSREKKDAN